ncbi:hypothetical protein FRC02_009585 [Tulasnella sp. 418]|nr:hypothetical protein FRC02_009585 [Tulasnella sp. 418]
MGHATHVGDIMPTLTPACLKYLAFEAPNLRSVSVYFTSEWNLLKEALGEAESSSKLRKLDVGLSPLSFPPTAGCTRSDVSALLLSCFPELEELVNEYYREWTLIRRALVSGVLVIGLESDDEMDW